MNGGALNYRRLTLRQAYLAEHFFNPKSDSFGIVARSARKAGYKGNPRTLAVVGFQTLRSPNMAREVKRRMEKVCSGDEVLQELTSVAKTEAEKVSTADKLKALELLGKFHKLFTDKVETIQKTEQIAVIEQTILKRSERTGEDVDDIALSLIPQFEGEPEFLDPALWGRFAHLLSKVEKIEGIQ